MDAYEAGYRAGYEAGIDAMRYGIRTGRVESVAPRSGPPRKKRPTKRTGKKDPKMAKALRKANKMGRTKAGKLRKGYTQAKIMKKAHQLRRKM